jgi:hypothetical protein
MVNVMRGLREGVMKKRTWAFASILFTGVVVVVCIAYALIRVFHAPANFASVAVLILVGLAAFIGIMNVLSVSSHLIGITNANQPFGLPEGTVRAILTIAFIVLVGVLASYMLTNAGIHEPFGEPIVMRGIAAKDADAVAQRYMADGVVSLDRRPGDLVDIQFRPRRDYALANDVAKQILTMLSTILAAMIGFYFGAQTPGSAAPADRSGNPDERSTIDKDLDGLSGQVQTVSKIATAKLATVDPAKRPQVQSIVDRLVEIDKAIGAARDSARDLSQPIDKVRAAHTAAKSAVAELPDLKHKLQAM